jgi:hypothetical protein
MANVVYNEAKKQAADAWLTGKTIRAILVMTNTTVNSENDGIAFVGDFATLDEFDGANYTANGKVLASVTITKDDANDRAKISANTLVWSSLGAGTRDGAGLLLLDWQTNYADSPPIAFIDRAFKADGSNLEFRFDGEAISGDFLRVV